MNAVVDVVWRRVFRAKARVLTSPVPADRALGANECGSAAKFSTILYFSASRLLRGHLQKAVFDAPGMAMQLTQLIGGGAICAVRKLPIQRDADVLLYLKMHGWSHAPHLASWEGE